MPANGSFTLAPGGNHIMLMNIPAPIKPGQDVTITLTCEGRRYGSSSRPRPAPTTVLTKPYQPSGSPTAMTMARARVSGSPMAENGGVSRRRLILGGAPRSLPSSPPEGPARPLRRRRPGQPPGESFRAWGRRRCHAPVTIRRESRPRCSPSRPSLHSCTPASTGRDSPG